jgi:hypothetical protein
MRENIDWFQCIYEGRGKYDLHRDRSGT